MRRGGGQKKRTTSRREIRPEDVLRTIRRTESRSADLRRILREFDATPVARRQIKSILAGLVRDGQLVRHRDTYQAFGAASGAAARPGPPRFAKTVTAEPGGIEGTILIHRDGYGFVVPAQEVQGLDGDIFIPAPLVGSSMNGDRVQVEVTRRKTGGRAEGRVIGVLKRARDTVVGQVRFDGREFFLAPADQKLPSRILLPDGASEHKDKIVEVELTRFPTAEHWPVGKIVKVIGFLDDPNVETQIIIRKFALPTAFPSEVEDEAARLPDTLSEADMTGREDFRGRFTITIDPDTARDFDDAIDVDRLEDGSFRLGVHIADVAHFVRPGSAMDREARIRGTSVYFPDRVLPMLPEKVSNHLCSLNPGTDRLAMSVLMHVSREGDVRDYSIHNSVIHSKERMTYGDVQKIIDGDADLHQRYAHLLPEIRKIEALARILQRTRHERGTIDFDLPEPALTYNDAGDLTGIVKSVRHFSHRIVEEFMILANEVVARDLEGRDIPSIYRIHEPPDPAKVEAFSELVATFGFKFRPKKIRPGDFQRFIASVEGRPEERMLSYLMLRSFKQAVYSSKNSGHFGLASDAYTHFTSPIRRYPDLVVHRILKATAAKQAIPALSAAQLSVVADESSERERTAAQAERELFEWKKILLMERRLGETFDAIVLSVWKDGFNVELVDQFIEGFVPVEDLPDREYRFDAADRVLIARSGKHRFRLGKRLSVQVVRVDKLLRKVYFRPVGT